MVHSTHALPRDACAVVELRFVTEGLSLSEKGEEGFKQCGKRSTIEKQCNFPWYKLEFATFSQLVLKQQQPSCWLSCKSSLTLVSLRHFQFHRNC